MYQQYPNYPQYPPMQPPPKKRSCLMTCLVTLTIFVFLALILIVGVVWYFKPRLSEQAGGNLANQLQQQIDQKVQEQVGGTTEDIPPGFVGQIVIPESDVNEYIRTHPQDIAPLESAVVHFQPGVMTADVSAYGVGGQASAGLQVGANGDIEVVNARVDGPLGWLLDGEQIGNTLESQLNSQLAANGQKITAIEIQQGQILATVQAR